MIPFVYVLGGIVVAICVVVFYFIYSKNFKRDFAGRTKVKATRPLPLHLDIDGLTYIDETDKLGDGRIELTLTNMENNKFVKKIEIIEATYKIIDPLDKQIWVSLELFDKTENMSKAIRRSEEENAQLKQQINNMKATMKEEMDNFKKSLIDVNKGNTWSNPNFPKKNP